MTRGLSGFRGVSLDTSWNDLSVAEMVLTLTVFKTYSPEIFRADNDYGFRAHNRLWHRDTIDNEITWVFEQYARALGVELHTAESRVRVRRALANLVTQQYRGIALPDELAWVDSSDSEAPFGIYILNTLVRAAYQDYKEHSELVEVPETKQNPLNQGICKMKKLFNSLKSTVGLAFLMVFSIIAVLLIICSGRWVTVNAGEVAVFTDRPFIGDGGVRKETLDNGRKWVWFTTTTTIVSILPDTVDVPFDDLATANRFLLDFSSQVKYQVTNPQLLIKSFGVNWWRASVEAQYRSIVRDEVKKHDMQKIMSDDKTAVAVDEAITKAITKYVNDAGIPVTIMNITLGRAKPNQDVLTQMNATSAEVERENTLRAKTNAERQRASAAEAAAIADVAYRNKLGYTPEQYLQLEKVRMMADACKAGKECIVYNGTAPLVTSK